MRSRLTAVGTGHGVFEELIRGPESSSTPKQRLSLAKKADENGRYQSLPTLARQQGRAIRQSYHVIL